MAKITRVFILMTRNMVMEYTLGWMEKSTVDGGFLEIKMAMEYIIQRERGILQLIKELLMKTKMLNRIRNPLVKKMRQFKVRIIKYKLTMEYGKKEKNSHGLISHNLRRLLIID